MTAHDRKPTSDHQPAGVEITPTMIAAGVRVIAEEYAVCSEYVAEGLAAEVFRAMLFASPHAGDFLGRSNEEGR